MVGEGEGNWLVYSPDGCEFYQTKELADEAAERFIDDYVANMGDEDHDEDYMYRAAQQVRVCKVVARAEVNPETCDLDMVPIHESFLLQH